MKMVGAELPGSFEALLVRIDGDDGRAGDACVLDGEVAQTPTPKTATRLAEVAPDTLTALYVVTPAHVSGAAASGSISAGTFTTCRAYATAYSANAPSIA